MCRCINCGKPTDCGEKYCWRCFIDKLETDAEKNLYAGGRFYGEKFIVHHCWDGPCTCATDNF